MITRVDPDTHWKVQRLFGTQDSLNIITKLTIMDCLINHYQSGACLQSFKQDMRQTMTWSQPRSPHLIKKAWIKYPGGLDPRLSYARHSTRSSQPPTCEWTVHCRVPRTYFTFFAYLSFSFNSLRTIIKNQFIKRNTRPTLYHLKCTA